MSKIYTRSIPLFCVLVAGACGDPCLDDGQGKGQCTRLLDDGVGDDGTGAGTGDDTAGDGDDGDADGDADGGDGLWCRDNDADGFGDPDDCVETDDPPEGFVENNDDCDDASADTFPGAAQTEDPEACMTDADDDGWGDADPSSDAAVPGTDCADDDDGTYPGAAFNESEDACMTDRDGDGWGESSPLGDAVPGTDCDDLAEHTHPGAAENEDPDACMEDADEDGFGNDQPSNPDVSPGSDCNDEDAATFVGAAPNDDPEACMQDSDGDDFGESEPDDLNTFPGSDCDDSDVEVLGGCGPTNWCPDNDEDGFGLASECIETEDPPEGWVPNGFDCDDGDASTFPGAAQNEDPEACMNDSDGDGWGDPDVSPGVIAGTDCNDDSAATFPGAAELEGDGCMEDADGDGLGSGNPSDGAEPGTDCDDNDVNIGVDCGCKPVYVSCDGDAQNPTDDPFAAIGVGCSDDPNEAVVLESSSFNVPDAGSWKVLAQYGSADDPDNDGFKMWAPRPDQNNPDAPHNAGNNMLLLTTGTFGNPDANGVLLVSQDQAQNGGNSNPDGIDYPAPISDADGSNGGAGGTPFVGCDGMGDCADSLSGLTIASLNDGAWMSFATVVPESTIGYLFDFAYMSAEYPAYVNTQFNDIFVVWVASEGFTGNAAITQGGAPFTVTELFDDGSFDILENDPRLADTGYEQHGATSWKSIRGAAEPGELLQLTFFLADVADSGFATQVLIDNFRWDCTGCEYGVDCGLSNL